MGLQIQHCLLDGFGTHDNLCLTLQHNKVTFKKKIKWKQRYGQWVWSPWLELGNELGTKKS